MLGLANRLEDGRHTVTLHSSPQVLVVNLILQALLHWLPCLGKAGDAGQWLQRDWSAWALAAVAQAADQPLLQSRCYAVAE